MLEPGKARWFGKALPERGGPIPATIAPATIAELTALCLFAPPCCGHIALCDGACRDARRDDDDARFGASAARDERR